MILGRSSDDPCYKRQECGSQWAIGIKKIPSSLHKIESTYHISRTLVAQEYSEGKKRNSGGRESQM